MMTPWEYLCLRVLQKNPQEKTRHEHYIKEYQGIVFEAKHEVGALIAKIRVAHEISGRTDWSQLISENGDKFTENCLDSEWSISDEAAKDLLLAFGGFDSPDEDLVDAISEIGGAIAEKIAGAPEISRCALVHPEIMALKKHTMIQKKAISAAVKSPSTLADESNSWQKMPEQDLENHLSWARFPKSGMIDFQRFSVSFLALAKKRVQVFPELKANEIAVSIDLGAGIGAGNPYASNGWSGVFKTTTATERFVFPKEIKLSNGCSRMSDVLFPDDAKFYSAEDVPLPPENTKSSKRIVVQPLVPLSFPPAIESMTYQDLATVSGIVDDAIKAIEEIRATPWQSPMQKKAKELEDREREARQAVEDQAKFDIEELIFRGSLHLNSLKKTKQ